MSTVIRPMVTENSPYWLPKHRYYELKHFCLQYPEWKSAYNSMSINIVRRPEEIRGSDVSDPTAKEAIVRAILKSHIDQVDRAIAETDENLGSYIFKAVTEGVSYNYMRTKLNMPCCKETFYKLYRKFFFVLSKYRM